MFLMVSIAGENFNLRFHVQVSDEYITNAEDCLYANLSYCTKQQGQHYSESLKFIKSLAQSDR